MKTLLLFIIFITQGGFLFSQKSKLPPKGKKYPISIFRFDYPIKPQEFTSIRNNSQNFTLFQTELSSLRFDTYDSVAIVPTWNQKTSNSEIIYSTDSLLSLFYKTGILSSDVLLKTINQESKFIDYKGDTSDYTLHINSKMVRLMRISQELSPSYIKYKKGSILLTVAVCFDEYNKNSSFLPSIYDFHIYLEGNFDFLNHDFEKYLRNLKKKYIQYMGIEI